MSDAISPWPAYSQDEISAVSAVLASGRVNYWTGSLCRQFENEFARWVGTRHSIALANGTLALEIALKALGLRPGDEVVTTPRTFIATASAIISTGASPVFADIDRDSQNITAETIRAVLTPRTKAILCVHLAGRPCDMDPIVQLAREYNLKIVEDCAQAHGARYKEKSVGSIGDIGCWSFCQDKIMTTGGEGGMITTNDSALWSSAWSLKDHGKNWEAVHERDHKPGYRWVHESFGTNARMLEMQAAIGSIQLKKMAEWTQRRTSISAEIGQSLRKFNCLRVPEVPSYMIHAYYRLYAFVVKNQLKSGWSRDRIIAEINTKNVPCFHGSSPEIYLEKAFDGTEFRPAERLPNAQQLGEDSIAFLVHPSITDDEVANMSNVIESVLSEASH